MPSHRDTLMLVREKFPGREQLIERAFRRDATFREMCREYRDCVVARERWKEREGLDDTPRWQEYAELVAELGREIEDWLDALGSLGPQSGGSGR